MSTINPEFVERYQIEYEKNPRSRIFAPLSEAYRQMGLVDEAVKICSQGVKLHPEFAGGRLAFARVLIAKGEQQQALGQLEKAVQISPDNLLAQSLLGDTLLNLRRPKDALKAYKMVLFINPNDEKALKAVRKWEFLSADEYEDELFKMQPVFQARKEEGEAPLIEPEPPAFEPTGDAAFDTRARLAAAATPWRKREIDRAISLADAFTVRNDLEGAMKVLQDARAELGVSEEIEKRLSLLLKRTQVAGEEDAREVLSKDASARKRLKLETFLRRINERRLDRRGP